MSQIRGIAAWACATLGLFGCFVSGLGGDRFIDERGYLHRWGQQDSR